VNIAAESKRTRDSEPLLQVEQLTKDFPVQAGLLRRVFNQLRAVDGVSLQVASGKTVGLVGESGCGKSTLGRAILQLQKPTAGNVFLAGREITGMPQAELKACRRDMQIIFQDPYASLSPRRTVAQIIREPLDVYHIGSPPERRRRVAELLEVVGLRPQISNRYPHEFSGGQRQRIGIARALAPQPKFIVADEPVSALDVSVQSQVLNLIAELKRDFGIAFLFISHDLAVIQHVSETVAVMYLGRLVEEASAEDIYRSPKHPYTEALLSAIPVPDPKRKSSRIILGGDVPSPAHPPSGCPFHPRCPAAMDRCSDVLPPRTDQGGPGRPHYVSCHLYSGAET
jgi:peptide/nickel transport system ATP-binding protein/oligopeptide transport system ATP-binding protein